MGIAVMCGAELGGLFCQESMSMVVSHCYVCCGKNRNIAMALGLSGTSGLVFKEGVRSNKKDCEKVTGVGVVPS